MLQSNYALKLANGISWFILPIHSTIYTVKGINLETQIEIAYPSILTSTPDCMIQSHEQLLIPSRKGTTATIDETEIKYNFSSIEREYLTKNLSLPSFRTIHIDTESIKSSASSLEASIEAYEEQVLRDRMSSYSHEAFSIFQFLSYGALLFLTILGFHKVGLFRPIIRPFKIGFNMCFDNRDNQPPNVVNQNLVHQGSTPLIVQYRPTPRDTSDDHKYEIL